MAPGPIYFATDISYAHKMFRTFATCVDPMKRFFIVTDEESKYYSVCFVPVKLFLPGLFFSLFCKTRSLPYRGVRERWSTWVGSDLTGKYCNRLTRDTILVGLFVSSEVKKNVFLWFLHRRQLSTQ